MTTLSVRPLPVRPLPGLVAAAAAAGVVLGVVDLVGQTLLPYPWANLANSGAVWALAASAFALRARTTPARAALAGTVLLVVAVEAYEVTAVLTDRAGTAALWSPSTLAWVGFGVVAGAVFGVAGTWAGSRDPWRAATGLGAVSAVFLAEAAARVRPGSESGLADLGTLLLTAGLGVAVLLTALDRPAHLARTVLLVGPLTLAGTLAAALLGG